MSKLQVTIDGQAFEVELSLPPHGEGAELTLLVNGAPVRVALPALGLPEQIEWAVVGNRPYVLEIDHDLRWVRSARGRHSVAIQDLEATVSRPASADGRIKAPIPGLIVRVLVEPGQQVRAGQPLLVLEAMKMQNEIGAPRDGVVASLNVQPGQAVKLHELLGEIG